MKRFTLFRSACVLLTLCGVCAIGLTPQGRAESLPPPSTETQPSLEAWQSPRYIEQAFMEVALNNEFSHGLQPVRKWREPMRIWVEYKAPEQDRYRTLMQLHLSHLQSITGHPISVVTDPTQANVQVLFTHQKTWPEDVRTRLGPEAMTPLKTAVCMASIHTNPKHEIDQAWVIIPVDQAEMQRKLVSCIVEEFTQIMGLPNDSEQVFPSIFNDRTPEALLTGLDWVLLKLLYHPNVKIGMQKGDLPAVIRPLLNTWAENGLLQKAEKEVRKSDLYEWMGY